MARRATNHIVIHCSATRPCQDIGAAEIRKWHKARGWKDIGYHLVIRRNGKVEKGRAIDQIGSHVAGHNADTVGVCLVGGLNDEDWAPINNFTKEQWASLRSLLAELGKKYPKATVLGHRDFPQVAKACPCFDAIPWAAKNGFPTPLK
jgi:N-acetylmuramoyl-L-alanine amidase